MQPLYNRMRSRNQPAVMTVMAGGLLLILLLVGITTGMVHIPTIIGDDPAGATPPLQGCDAPHWFASDAPAGSNFFGPAVTQTSVKDQLVELHNRRVLDPALVVAHAHYEGLPGFAELKGDDQFILKTVQLATTPDLWCGVIRLMEAQEKTKVASNAYLTGPYQTLYMVYRGADVPLIRVANPDRPKYMVLRIGDWFFKLDCGFQPVSQAFPGVPPVSQPTPPPGYQPPAPPPPNPTTPTTAPPPPPCPNGVCPKNEAESPDHNPAVPLPVIKHQASSDNAAWIARGPEIPHDTKTGCVVRCSNTTDTTVPETTVITAAPARSGASSDTSPTNDAPAPGS